MTLEEFLSMERLPNSRDIMGLCEHLGISFKVNEDGKPVIAHPTDLKPEAQALAGILRRNPWRCEIIEAKNLVPKQKPDPVDSQPQPCRICGATIIWCQTEGETVMPLDATTSEPGNFALYAIVNGLAIRCDGPGYRAHVQTCKPPEYKRYQ